MLTPHAHFSSAWPKNRQETPLGGGSPGTWCHFNIEFGGAAPGSQNQLRSAERARDRTPQVTRAARRRLHLPVREPYTFLDRIQSPPMYAPQCRQLPGRTSGSGR